MYFGGTGSGPEEWVACDLRGITTDGVIMMVSVLKLHLFHLGMQFFLISVPC